MQGFAYGADEWIRTTDLLITNQFYNIHNVFKNKIIRKYSPYIPDL